MQPLSFEELQRTIRDADPRLESDQIATLAGQLERKLRAWRSPEEEAEAQASSAGYDNWVRKARFDRPGCPSKKTGQPRQPFQVPWRWQRLLDALNVALYRESVSALLPILTRHAPPERVVRWWITTSPSERMALLSFVKRRRSRAAILSLMDSAILRLALEAFGASRRARFAVALDLPLLAGQGQGLSAALSSDPEAGYPLSDARWHAALRYLLGTPAMLRRLRWCQNPGGCGPHQCPRGRYGHPLFVDRSPTYVKRPALGCCPTHQKSAWRAAKKPPP